MNCQQIRQQIKTASTHSAELTEDLTAHISGCELCHRWYGDFKLDQVLDDFDVPEPDIGLVDRVVAKASQKQKRRFGDTPRLAVAASIALLSLALGLFLGQAQPADMSFEVAIAPHEDRIVQVVINASTARSQALLTISLADSLELSGFPEQRVVQWHTDLVEGKNLLSLPIRLLDENDSFFTVRMVHGSAEQSMRIDVRAKRSSVESFSA